MSGDARCVHDMLPGTCAWCTGRDGGASERARERADASAHPGLGTVVARWPGRCAGCGDDYPAGTPIRSDGAGGWSAPCCSGYVS